MNKEEQEQLIRKQAKYGWSWCGACDRQIVSDGVKCPVCGTKNNLKKIRYD